MEINQMAEKSNSKKKPYVKPVVHIIEIAADEVLAGGCKTSSSAGPNQPIFGNTCTDPGTCFQQGS